MGSGLALFKLGDLGAALERFEAAMEEAVDRTLKSQVTVLLSQTLWAIGTEELKDSSKNQLLES